MQRQREHLPDCAEGGPPSWDRTKALGTLRGSNSKDAECGRGTHGLQAVRRENRHIDMVVWRREHQNDPAYAHSCEPLSPSEAAWLAEGEEEELAVEGETAKKEAQGSRLRHKGSRL